MLGVRLRCIEAFVYFVGFAGKEGKGMMPECDYRHYILRSFPFENMITRTTLTPFQLS